MKCRACPFAKPLAFAVYCKYDPELRDLPGSIGYIVGTPRIQETPPEWCAVPADEEPQPVRTSGDVICEACGKPYKRHPFDLQQLYRGEPYLNVLCDGQRVKL